MSKNPKEPSPKEVKINFQSEALEKAAIVFLIRLQSI